jgi:hypothetical protein
VVTHPPDTEEIGGVRSNRVVVQKIAIKMNKKYPVVAQDARVLYPPGEHKFMCSNET